MNSPKQKSVMPTAKRVCVEAAGGALELRDGLAVVDDRPGDQLREEHHEEEIVAQGERLDAAAGDVDQEGDLLEGDERDAERQDHLVEDEVLPAQVVHHRDGEVRVLEVAEEADVEGDAERQQQGAAAGARPSSPASPSSTRPSA